VRTSLDKKYSAADRECLVRVQDRLGSSPAQAVLAATMNPGVFDIIEQHKGRRVELQRSNTVVVLVGSLLAGEKKVGKTGATCKAQESSKPPWEMVSSRCDMTP